MLTIYRRSNEALAVWITNAVSTMTCAYLFTVLALTGFPGAIRDTIHQSSFLPLDQWLSQNFLQLVLLPIIMVGQNVQNRRIEALHAKHDDLHAMVKDALND